MEKGGGYGKRRDDGGWAYGRDSRKGAEESVKAEPVLEGMSKGLKPQMG